jgi:phage N-6-adenine-methyltransferase
MPLQKPGRSKQDYQTPPEFLKAVHKRLLTQYLWWDLAASAENSVGHAGYFDEETNSLKQDWDQWADQSMWLWCNPPYSDIGPWVAKAAASKAHIAMLVPASVGAKWWYDHVDGIAHVLFLKGRLTFPPETKPYPKDCALLLYTPFVKGGYEVWNWRNQG